MHWGCEVPAIVDEGAGTFRLRGLIMGLKAIPAIATLVGWILLPAPSANADGQCTDKTNAQAHQVCMAMANGQCGGIGMFGVSHSTCTYPDGSRDECDWHLTSLTSTAGSCTWFASPPAFPIGPPPAPDAGPPPMPQP